MQLWIQQACCSEFQDGDTAFTSIDGGQLNPDERFVDRSVLLKVVARYDVRVVLDLYNLWPSSSWVPPVGGK